MVSVVIIEALCERSGATNRGHALDGFLTGAILGLLLFLKITYFVGLGFLLVAFSFCRRQTLSRWIGIVSGTVVVSLIFLIYIQFALRPMWDCLAFLAAARQLEFRPNGEWAWRMCALPFLLFVWGASRLLWAEGAHEQARNLFVAGLATVSAGMFFRLTNWQFNRFPLEAVAAIVIVNTVVSRSDHDPRSMGPVRAAIVLWAAFFVIGGIAVDGQGLAAAWNSESTANKIPRTGLGTERLRGVRSFEFAYVGFVNEGFALLNQYRRPDDTVASLEFSNPFSYGLAMKPPVGGTPIGLVYNINFDEQNFIRPQEIFRGSTLLMVPGDIIDANLTRSIQRVYGSYVHSHFHVIAKSRNWTLLRNNDSPGGP